MPPIIIKERCNACGICAEICPMDVFGATGNGDIPVVKYPEECWHCNSCVLDCPEGAVSLRVPLPVMMLYVEAGDSIGG